MNDGFFNFKASKLADFQKLQYQSKSHTFNKAVVAAYYNVKKYGFETHQWGFLIKQSKRTVNFLTDDDIPVTSSDQKSLYLSERLVFKNKTKEICYDLKELFTTYTTTVSRGLKFSDRPEVRIENYRQDVRLDLIYGGWKVTKESDPKTFMMTFNPARYYRSYELLDHGYPIYQKLISIKTRPYALINFALQDQYAYELSFLSLYKDLELKLINDQNDCIIVNCLYDLYKLYGIRYVNLGTGAGIKGLTFFKKKLPNFENIVYSQ